MQPIPARLTADNITFGYRRTATPVLNDWSADFPAATMTAITGPSGTGKSTLLYLLGLMIRPQRGLIRLADTRVDHLGEARRTAIRAHHFGFVFQDAVLDPRRTVLDNVIEPALYRRTPRSTAIQRATGLLDRLGVAVRATHRPGEISGGQAQRIALCRALLGDPTYVFADEPTGNLDSASARLVLHTLRRCADNGAVVIVATHDTTVMDECDRHLSLEAACST